MFGQLFKGLMLAIGLVFFNLTYAENIINNPLRVSVTYYTPPFVIVSGHGNYLGFDLNMLNYICSYLQRKCTYNSMQFSELIPSILNKKSDLAIGGVIITPNRLLNVGMSKPYLSSSSRFLTYVDNNIKIPSAKSLKKARIGVEKGSVFAEQLRTWKIDGIKIDEYISEGDEIQALVQKRIDFVLMDNYSAIFWERHSEKKLKVLGRPIKYGYGYGIVIDPNNKALIAAVNKAIDSYVNSSQYKENYKLYLSEF